MLPLFLSLPDTDSTQETQSASTQGAQLTRPTRSYMITNPYLRTISGFEISVGKESYGSPQSSPFVWLLNIKNYNRLGGEPKKGLETTLARLFTIQQQRPNPLFLRPVEQLPILIKNQGTDVSGVLTAESSLIYEPKDGSHYIVVEAYEDAFSLQTRTGDNRLDWHSTVGIIAELIDVILQLESEPLFYPILRPDTLLITNQNSSRLNAIVTTSRSAQYHPLLFDVGFHLQLRSWEKWLHALSVRDLYYLSPEVRQSSILKKNHVYTLAILTFELATDKLLELEASDLENSNLLAEKLAKIAKESKSYANQDALDVIREALCNSSMKLSDFKKKLKKSSALGGTQIDVTPTPVQFPPIPSSKSSKQRGRQPQTAQYERVVWQHPRHGTDESEPITKETDFITVGYAEQNDIVLPIDPLDAPNISERHFCIWKLSEGDYTVTDMGVNGGQSNHRLPLLNGVPLSPIFAAHITYQDKIELGDFLFQLKRGPHPSEVRADRLIARLDITRSEYFAKPGDTLTIPFRVEYLNEIVEDFMPVLDGLPSNWRPSLPTSIRYLGVGANASSSFNEASFQIIIPSIERTIAKKYQLVFRLISTVHKAQVAAQKIIVHIEQEYRYSCRIEPLIVKSGYPLQLFVKNQGNFTTTFRAQWSDNEGALTFKPNNTIFTIRPGQIGTLGVAPSYWRFWGSQKYHAITVDVLPEGSEIVQTVSGQVISHAMIRPWMAAIAMLLAALTLLLGFTIFKPAFTQHKVYPDSAVIAGNAVTLNWNAKYACFNSVLQNDLVIQPLTKITKTNNLTVVAGPANSVIEVQLRNCLFVAGDPWKIQVVAPPPQPLLPPEMITFTTVTTQTLHGAEGDLCFEWQVVPTTATLTLLPLALPIEKELVPIGNKCFPYAQLFTEAKSYSFQLQATNPELATSNSAPISVEVLSPICKVIDVGNDVVNLRTGNGINFDKVGELRKDNSVLLHSRPFYQVNKEEHGWVQISAQESNDPRIFWVDFAYLNCKPDILRLINTLPLPNEVPLTPTPTATLTPSPTITPSPTVTPFPTALPTPDAAIDINITPPVIEVGACAVLSWNIQNVLEIHINGAPAIGEFEQAECPTVTTVYQFAIKLRDGSTKQVVKTLVVNPKPAPPTPPIQ